MATNIVASQLPERRPLLPKISLSETSPSQLGSYLSVLILFHQLDTGAVCGWWMERWGWFFCKEGIFDFILKYQKGYVGLDGVRHWIWRKHLQLHFTWAQTQRYSETPLYGTPLYGKTPLYGRKPMGQFLLCMTKICLSIWQTSLYGSKTPWTNACHITGFHCILKQKYL